MSTSYDVKVGAIQQRAYSYGIAFIVRWTVARKPRSKSFRAKQSAYRFISDMRQAARKGEPFDVVEGLPLSMLHPPSSDLTFLEYSQTYLLDRWPASAARTRETEAYALLSLTPALVMTLPRRPSDEVLREILRSHALLPVERRKKLTDSELAALNWLQRASVPMAELATPALLRRGLAAISITFAGQAASANTVRRKRAVLHHLLERAVEDGLFTRNPLSGIKWRPPRAITAVDVRTVVNPSQAHQLLEAVPKVGRSRGARLKAMFASMYYAALRPEEAADLREENCFLPETGWGMLTLDSARPQIAKRWSDGGQTHESRSLKHRARKEVRRIPIPPVLVTSLRKHITINGIASDGRLFHTSTGGSYSSSAYGQVWKKARMLALSPEQAATVLAARPYDLRHAGISLWLHAGVPPVEVAQRAGHSVEMLLRVYAGCLEGQQNYHNARIDSALQQRRHD